MIRWNGHYFSRVLLIALIGLGVIGGCDSGKKATEEVTGHRAVKQYHTSKKDIQKIAEKQAERDKGIPDYNEKEDEKQ